MSFGTISKKEEGGVMPSAPVFCHRIQFDGDTAYPDGGTPGFKALVQAAIGVPGADILSVVKAGPCGGYEPVYDHANDKLMFFYYDYDAGADGAAIQVIADHAMDGITIDLVVFSQ